MHAGPLPSDEGANARELEHETEERGEGEHGGDGRREADARVEADREVRAEHVEDAVSDVDDALQAEDDGEPRREEDVDRPDREAVQRLEDDGHRVGPPTSSAVSASTPR